MAHHQRVHAYALRRTDAASADDVLAETFAVAWRRLGEVPAEALPFLLGVARRVLANQRRSERRRVALGRALSETTATTSAQTSDAALGSALASLNERDRELLLLTAWDGLSPAEAACVVGCTKEAVYVRLHRARGRLAELLSADEPAHTTLNAEVRGPCRT